MADTPKTSGERIHDVLDAVGWATVDEFPRMKQLQPWQEEMLRRFTERRSRDGKFTILSTVAPKPHLPTQVVSAYEHELHEERLQREGWSSPQRTRELEQAVDDLVAMLDAGKDALREILPRASSGTAFDLSHVLGKLESPPIRLVTHMARRTYGRELGENARVFHEVMGAAHAVRAKGGDPLIVAPPEAREVLRRMLDGQGYFPVDFNGVADSDHVYLIDRTHEDAAPPRFHLNRWTDG